MYSCTSLLSWYSSIAISSNFCEYFFAISVVLTFPLSSWLINICKAKCSTSVKSTIFLSRFLLANLLSNSLINISSLCNFLYILYKSFAHCLESAISVFSLFLLKRAFTISLIFFASSFISDSTFFFDQSTSLIYPDVS